MFIRNEIMQEKGFLAESIASTIKNYENNSFCKSNDKYHVLKWVGQFNEDDQLFVLQQTDALLKKQYFTKETYEQSR